MTNDKKSLSDEEKALFRRAVAGTRPLDSKIVPSAQTPKTRIKIHSDFPDEQIEQNTLADISDTKVTGESVLSFRRAGISHRDMQILKRGNFTTTAILDLHGQTVAQARESVMSFLNRCQKRQLRYARVIHGKGKTSQQGHAILKNQVSYWLQQCENVLAFCSAKSTQGGTGAVNVLLKTTAKNVAEK